MILNPVISSGGGGVSVDLENPVVVSNNYTYGDDDAIVLTTGIWNGQPLYAVYNLVTMTYYAYGAGPWQAQLGLTEVLGIPDHLEIYFDGITPASTIDTNSHLITRGNYDGSITIYKKA